MQNQNNSTVDQTIERAKHFILRHPKEEEIQKTYGYFTNHPFAPLNKKRLDVILTILEKRATMLGRPLRVLDLACGGGLITCSVASLGHRCIGFDYSHAEVRLAQIFAEENKVDAIFAQADLIVDEGWEKKAEEALGGKPDIAVLAYALHHLPKVEIFMKRLGSWLDNSAMLIVNEENPSSPTFRLKHIIRGWIQKDTDVEWHRTFPAWKELLASEGFSSITSITGLDMLPLIQMVQPTACWSLVFTAEKTDNL